MRQETDPHITVSPAIVRLADAQAYCVLNWGKKLIWAYVVEMCV